MSFCFFGLNSTIVFILRVTTISEILLGVRCIVFSTSAEQVSIPKTPFTEFYSEFETKSSAFLNKNYSHSDPYKSRRFTLYGSYFYWIPLTDLPGTE